VAKTLKFHRGYVCHDSVAARLEPGSTSAKDGRRYNYQTGVKIYLAVLAECGTLLPLENQYLQSHE
jgi:hypothetical protein